MVQIHVRCVFSWATFWPALAQHFGMKYTTPDDDAPGTEYHKFPLPLGGALRFKFTLAEWGQRPENVKTYKELAKEQGFPDDYIEASLRTFQGPGDELNFLHFNRTPNSWHSLMLPCFATMDMILRWIRAAREALLDGRRPSILIWR
jgi:hypothetical protein